MSDREDTVEQQRFEEWYAADSMPCEADWFRKDADGDYADSFVAQAWRGWAAREPLAGEIERLRAEVARLREGLERVAAHARNTPGLSYDSLEQLIDSATASAKDALETPATPGSTD